MNELMEYLPLMIPLVAAQFALLGYALYHILSHKTYKRGTRTLWLVVTLVLMNFVGPILYFIFGKEET
ncbi:MAG: PLDc_N domain-containing protein [Ruminococcaceae bacterium]|nr:PLDc_N domain-containing protein [Oscillospiraceae bacterium]